MKTPIQIQNAQIHKLFFQHWERNSEKQIQIQNTQIVFISAPGKEFCILASEDATVRPVQLAGNAFHLQGTDQRDCQLKEFHKGKKFTGISSER